MPKTWVEMVEILKIVGIWDVLKMKPMGLVQSLDVRVTERK